MNRLVQLVVGTLFCMAIAAAIVWFDKCVEYADLPENLPSH